MPEETDAAEAPARQTPPADFAALKTEILQRKDRLPNRLRQIAMHALQDPDAIAFGTVASIATAAGVQPSTLVRFAQTLGFEGFSGLQALFRERLRERQSGYDERLSTIRALDGAAGPAAILRGFVEAAHRSLDTLSTGVDPAAFEAAAHRLADAETIHLIARRRSYPVGTAIAYAFAKARIRHQISGSAAGIDEDVLALAGPRDVALAISFSPYAAETVQQVRALARRNVPVISLTDSVFSPLAELSTVWFELAEADHAGFRSLSASLAFGMALSVAVAEERQRRDRGTGDGTPSLS